MAQIAAFGRSHDTDSDGGLERQLSNLRDLYENALLLDGAGDLDAAESAYEEVLQQPILSNALDTENIPKAAILLRSLTLKNLAALHIRQSRFAPGLNCYILSAQQTPDGWRDGSLLNRIGSCARQLDLLALARHCFERCLHHQPGHRKALQSLLEIVADCGDRDAFLRLKNYARYTSRVCWSENGLERFPEWQNGDSEIQFDRFSKRRRVAPEISPVQHIDLVWRYDSEHHLTFDKLFDFLLVNIDRLYSQHQPFEALTAPICIQLEMSDQTCDVPSPASSPEHRTDDDSKTDSSSLLSPDVDDDDRLENLFEFLHQALPQQDIHLDSGRLIFSSQSSPSSPAIKPSSSYDEPSAVRSLLATISTTNSGIMIVAQRIWNVVAESSPPSLSAERLLSIRHALNDKMLLTSSAADVLLAAEITFDRDPEAVAPLISDLHRHLDDVFIRGCWLLGLWHTHHGRHLTAYLYFSQCADRIAGHVLIREKCCCDRVISAATIATKLSSLSMWELCEGAIASNNDCAQQLYEMCVNGDSDFSGVPHLVGVAAIEAIRRRFSSDLVLLQLIITSVPPTSFDDAALSRFRLSVEDLTNSESLLYLPGRLVDETCHALSQALYLALHDDLSVEVVSLITFAIVQFSCRYGAGVSTDPTAQVELYGAGHKFLSQFDGGCSVRNCRFLHFGLEFIDDVRDRAKFDAISAIYCCLYGPLDPRFDCHQGFETVRLQDQPLPLDKCRNLLDYCFAAEKFLSDQERAEFAARNLSLLKQLRGSIRFPEDLQPDGDFISNAINDSRYQLPFITCYSDEHDIYSRYYDYFAQRLVSIHSVCSYATRICASVTSDMNVLNELLRCDLLLHPRRSRSWYALSWCFLHQRIGFVQGVQSTIDSLQDNDFDSFFQPLLCARRCLKRTDSLLQAESDCIEELGIYPKLSLTCERVILDQLVLELRLLEYFSRVPYGCFSTAPQLKRIQRTLRRLPESPRTTYVQAVLLECIQASAADILHHYAIAAKSITDALYAVHALRLDLALCPTPDWQLISKYSYSGATENTLQSVLDDVAAVFSHLCEQDPEFFRPALRLAQVALLTGSATCADRAVSELSLFINDKTRLRRVRPRKGSLSPSATDIEFIRALLYDPSVDYAEEDCYIASLVLCRNRGNWEELESIYYNAVRPRRDKHITLMYASILISTLNEWATSLRENVDVALRDSLFKRAFECCLDLMRGQREAQVFMPALLVLPYRIVKEETPSDGDILQSDVVDHEEVRQARDWCAELQCARSVRNALKRLSIPVRTYNLQHHIVPIEAEFKSFRTRR